MSSDQTIVGSWAGPLATDARKTQAQRIIFYLYISKKWDEPWSEIAQRRVLKVKTRALMFENPRPKDLKRVKKEE